MQHIENKGSAPAGKIHFGRGYAPMGRGTKQKKTVRQGLCTGGEEKNIVLNLQVFSRVASALLNLSSSQSRRRKGEEEKKEEGKRKKKKERKNLKRKHKGR